MDSRAPAHPTPEPLSNEDLQTLSGGTLPPMTVLTAGVPNLALFRGGCPACRSGALRFVLLDAVVNPITKVSLNPQPLPPRF